jgi:hypothetical protein
MFVKKLFFILITVISICVFAATACKSKQLKPKDKVTVSGKVTQTSSYCGGARPTDELLEELATPRMYSGKKFHVIKGDTNVVTHQLILTFVTDENGNFSFELEPGTYSLLTDEQATEPDYKKYSTKDVGLDESCFKSWWATPYYKLNIASTPLTHLNFNFTKRCFISHDIPCLRYRGPMPP